MLKKIFPSLAMANVALPDEIYSLVDSELKRRGGARDRYRATSVSKSATAASTEPGSGRIG
jgi:hypothetical protein